MWVLCLLTTTFLVASADGESGGVAMWSPRDLDMILPTCCNYQRQFSEVSSNCSDRPPNNPLTFDETFNLPPHLLSDGYRNRTHLQNIKFRLAKEPPVCPDGSFSVILDFNQQKEGVVLDPSLFIALTPNAHLQVGIDYYSPKEYCIDAVETSRVTFAICKPTCDERRPCIPKCCDLGQVWDFGDSHVPRCGDVPVGKPWEPSLYADKYTKLTREEQAALIPHYVLHHPASGFCDYGHPFLISLNTLQHGVNGILFRVLKDGSIVTRVRRRQWAFLPRGDYCLDGIRNPFQGASDVVEQEPETVIFYCHKDTETSESTISTLYGVAMIISCLFLLATLGVFGLLWEKYRGNIQRWTICCYVCALLLMYIFFILSYFSPNFDSDVVTNAPLCRFIGIGMHFTFLMNFCFLSTINFEIWWTVRTFVNQSTFFQGFVRLFTYIGFSVGLPLIIVSVGLILESLYESDVDSEVIIPEYGRLTCNIGSRDAFWAYMYGPLWVLLVANIFFFVTTIVTMSRILKAAKADSNVTIGHKKQSDLVSRFGKLYIITGGPWIFELVSFAAHEDEYRWYWILFDLINIFQSVAIFIILLCNRETIFALQENYPFLRKILLPVTPSTPNGRNNVEKDNEDSGKLSTVEVDANEPKNTMEMN